MPTFYVLKSIAGRKKSGFEMTSEYIVETQQLKLLGHADIMSLAIAGYAFSYTLLNALKLN